MGDEDYEPNRSLLVQYKDGSYHNLGKIESMNENLRIGGDISFPFQLPSLNVEYRFELSGSVSAASAFNKPKRVIYSNPATICFWPDGSKTVVKCHEGDTYSKQTGLLMCIAKHYYGNNGRWYDVLRDNGALAEDDDAHFSEYVTGYNGCQIRVGDMVKLHGDGFLSYTVEQIHKSPINSWVSYVESGWDYAARLERVDS